MCFVLFVGANSRSVMVTFAECIDKENDEMKEITLLSCSSMKRKFSLVVVMLDRGVGTYSYDKKHITSEVNCYLSH